MKKSFYSHGKLLLTGEYLVLDGVPALAIPTKKGQWLFIEEIEGDDMLWQSYDENGNCWFETRFVFDDDGIKEANTTESDVSKTLIEILTAAKVLNTNFLSTKKGYKVESRLEFNREWGLGSSSTLINNIAKWAKVDAFTLLENSFGGSGYDIACAQHDTSILYKRNPSKPLITEVEFDPIFKDHLFFVYLNQKQDSKDSIKHYQSLPLKDFDKAESTVKEITNNMIACTTIESFESLVDAHEQIISKIIKTPTIKSTLFSDYTRSVKSLGGWGGDFILTIGTLEDMNYFIDKGYTTVISYKDMVL
ncbi:GYDIA family GHMP kinase [Aquimarina algicola]|uniref:GHMP kinase n=1 Tax=Aquimarina algicola TaxID=2589995 RepID=A0A504JI26_9FLAO|nr:GYDIA family GHMP kinase [Aquimarina algicola]TPN86121.1 GHMP kinase [Aquimarina algicola]